MVNKRCDICGGRGTLKFRRTPQMTVFPPEDVMVVSPLSAYLPCPECCSAKAVIDLAREKILTFFGGGEYGGTIDKSVALSAMRDALREVLEEDQAPTCRAQ